VLTTTTYLPPLTDEQSALAAKLFALALSRFKRLSPASDPTICRDMVYDGCVDALVRAARRYDPERGYEPTTIVQYSCDREGRRRYTAGRPIAGQIYLTDGLDPPAPNGDDRHEQATAAIAPVLAAMRILDDRERWVLAGRFGLNGREPVRLIDLARELDITRERVRQIEQAALAKLRAALNPEEDGDVRD
jgi:hypothetical protein